MEESPVIKKRGRSPQIITDPTDLALLREVGELTVKIHAAQETVIESAKARRDRLRALRSRGVTFRVISQHTGITENSIYKDLSK
jgi:hypothetical protein